MIPLPLLIAAIYPPTPAGQVATVADMQGFAGEILLAEAGKVTLDRGFGQRQPGGAVRARQPSDFKAGERWRWASVTKQLVAVLAMQEVARGRLVLDAPVTRYLPGFKGPTGARVTIRQLLRHESGLPDPDEDPKAFTPDFRGRYDAESGICAGPVRDKPGASFRYNNCDFIVAGRVLERVTGQTIAQLVQTRIAAPVQARSIAFASAKVQPPGGYVDGKPEMPLDVPAYGSAGGLTGSLSDLWRFDQALLSGKLLPAKARAEMWDGQPRLGFAALGQWVFSVPLAGCKQPVRIVERRGQIGGIAIRNILLPDRDIVLIAATNRGDTDFGEIWQGQGLAHDLIAAAACPQQDR